MFKNCIYISNFSAQFKLNHSFCWKFSNLTLATSWVEILNSKLSIEFSGQEREGSVENVVCLWCEYSNILIDWCSTYKSAQFPLHLLIVAIMSSAQLELSYSQYYLSQPTICSHVTSWGQTEPRIPTMSSPIVLPGSVE